MAERSCREEVPSPLRRDSVGPGVAFALFGAVTQAGAEVNGHQNLVRGQFDREVSP